MGNEDIFLRAMLASPDDPSQRLVYADWLEDHADPRASLLRSNWDTPRLSYVDWVANRGNLDFYLEKFPELRGDLPELEANRSWREQLQAIGPAIKAEWLAVIDTLGRPFRPFYFWNNTGPRAYEVGQLPFRETIGARGAIVTFESAFRGDAASEPGLAEDLAFLCQLKLDECEYGAASCPVHPYACEFESADRALTGIDVLQALKANDFRSQHITTLDAREIPLAIMRGRRTMKSTTTRKIRPCFRTRRMFVRRTTMTVQRRSMPHIKH